jgi:hypothetical protein
MYEVVDLVVNQAAQDGAEASAQVRCPQKFGGLFGGLEFDAQAFF